MEEKFVNGEEQKYQQFQLKIVDIEKLEDFQEENYVVDLKKFAKIMYVEDLTKDVVLLDQNFH